jgi:hypothetical protein
MLRRNINNNDITQQRAGDTGVGAAAARAIC